MFITYWLLVYDNIGSRLEEGVEAALVVDDGRYDVSD